MFTALLTLALLTEPKTPSALLVAVGRQWGVASIIYGKEHPALSAEAQRHAEYQAKATRQGHQGWNLRVARLQRELPGFVDWAEVANESWPGQDEVEASHEMFRSWRLSAGHWRSVNSPWTHYGYGMARGRNGTWYACGIFCRGRR